MWELLNQNFDLLSQNFNRVIVVTALFAVALCLRQFLVYSGQRWMATFSHTATICLLPIITYVITSVISGNIALSLGLVGALSIVRFRNPVRSPFELAVYFVAITLGIAASVDIRWTILLAASVVGVIMFLLISNALAVIFLKKPMFSTSFSEGNSMPTLEITSYSELPELISHQSTVSAYTSQENYRYVIASSNRRELAKIHNALKTNPHVTSMNMVF